MKDELLLHLETTHIELTADSGANTPGTTLKLMGGDNELSIESTGNVADDSKLSVNEVEIVLETTLKSYANGEFNPGGVGFVSSETDTVRVVGAGTSESPAEAHVLLPASSDETCGLIKLAQEGSHGYPCPGLSDWTMTGVYDPIKDNMLLLRNGADDLEKDVFIANVNCSTGVYTPTAERFRPARLPITAKPINCCISAFGTVLLNTTEYLYVMLTEESVDYNNWRAIKLEFEPHPLIKEPGSGTDYWRGRFTVRRGDKVYMVVSYLNNSNHRGGLWEGTITDSDVMQMVYKPLTGINLTNTEQTGLPHYSLVDKVWGSSSENCLFYDPTNYWSYSRSYAHHGDELDFYLEGSKLRVCHDGYMYYAKAGASGNSRHNLSYVINLDTYTVEPDRTTQYPVALNTNGLSVPVHRPLLNEYGGNEDFTPIRSGNVALGFIVDNLAITPRMWRSEPINGKTHFEALVAGANSYRRTWTANDGITGVYGGVVRMGWGAAHAVDDDVYIGINTDGTRSRVAVDPHGSYGPTIPGYGPTNDRVELDRTKYEAMKMMVSYYDGRKVRLAGTVLSDLLPKAYSGLDAAGNPSMPVELDIPAYNLFRDKVLARISSDYTGIKKVNLSLMVHRCPDAPFLGMLQFMHLVDQVYKSVTYVFTYRPNRITGKIDDFTFGQELYRNGFSSNTTDISNPWFCCGVASSSIYRLEDGNYVVSMTGMVESWIGNGGAPQYCVVWDTYNDTKYCEYRMSLYSYLRHGHMYCKSYGFGLGYQSTAGESYYFKSYGTTKDSVKAAFQNSTDCPVYTLVMSRTDAGDNVAISQAAATKLREKVLTALPPSRRVQGMDLTQDRTITLNMLANTDRIPNVADVAYPVQTIHRDSLNGKALTNHTHQAADFTMAVATKNTYGSNRLGTLSDSDTLAASAQVMKEMPMSQLVSRKSVLVKLDVTMPVDVEI